MIALSIPAGEVTLDGDLDLLGDARGLVIFSHGSGSGRDSPRNRFVARALHAAGLATLLLDLLTPEEDRDYRMRFDIPLLTRRLVHAVRFARSDPRMHDLPIGLFGASTGAASALCAASANRSEIAAVVSRGGRPDLAGSEALRRVRAPALLIVGGLDTEVLALNEAARRELAGCESALEVVAGATHLFEEAGTLEEVAALAERWFARHLGQHPNR